MSALEAFGLVAGVAAIAAIPLTIFYARRQTERRRLLVYDALVSRFPLVSGRSLADYKLSVVFQREGGAEQRVPTVYVHYLRFANFGREAIRRADIAPAKPLELRVEPGPVLDIAVEAVRRSVSNISVDPDVMFTDDFASATITFDFLDYHDGAMIRVLATSPPKDMTLSLTGEIIGMPEGIQNAQAFRSRPYLDRLGVGLSMGLFLAALVITPFVFRWVTGEWSNVWLLALPLVALVVPLVVVFVVSVTIWPKSGVDFPRELVPRFRGLPPFVVREMHAGPMFMEEYESFSSDDGGGPDRSRG